MDTSLNNIPLPPWQDMILTWMGGVTLVLLLALVLMLLVRFYKKRGKDKIHTAFCFVFCAFILSFLIYMTVGASFFVSIELGWKLSLLTGASVVLFAISNIALIRKIFGSHMKRRHLFIWIALLVLSSASLMTFVIISSPKDPPPANPRASLWKSRWGP